LQAGRGGSGRPVQEGQKEGAQEEIGAGMFLSSDGSPH
jgi:hypothetical protein